MLHPLTTSPPPYHQLISCRRLLCNDMPIPSMGFDSQSKDAASVSSSGAVQELQAGPFVLRTLLDHVPLSEDGDDDHVKINCVDYLGEHCRPDLTFDLTYLGILTDLCASQAAISTSAPLPPSSSTSSRSLPILPTTPVSLFSSWPRGFAQPTPRPLSQAQLVRSRECSRSFFFPESKRHACCATTLSLSIPCPS